MLRTLAALALAALAGSLACAKCVSLDLAPPPRCAPLPDAGSPDCAAAEACVASSGSRLFHCAALCGSGGCASGFDCRAAAVGDGCAQGNPDRDPDAGKYGGGTGGCTTVYVCEPTVCGK